MKGAKEDITPEKVEGTAYRGATGSTIDSIAQDSGKSKEKTGHIWQQCCDICPISPFVWCQRHPCKILMDIRPDLC